MHLSGKASSYIVRAEHQRAHSSRQLESSVAPTSLNCYFDSAFTSRYYISCSCIFPVVEAGWKFHHGRLRCSTVSFFLCLLPDSKSWHLTKLADEDVWVHYDTTISLFATNSGPKCHLMSAIVGWLCFLIVSVDDYACGGCW